MIHESVRGSGSLLRGTCGLCLLAAVMSLAGCNTFSGTADRKVPARNFNELIPRLMGAIENKSPEEAAAHLFDVTNADERRDAIAYLETKPYGHQPPYMNAYQLLATDPNPLVRGQAMRALGSSYQEIVVTTLIRGLDETQASMVRLDAVMGLRQTFGEAAVPALAGRVRQDSDDQVRAWSAVVLARAQSTEAIRALIDALSDREASVAFWAHDSLVRITAQDYGYDTRAWLSWFREAHAASATQSATQGAGGAGTAGGGGSAPGGAGAVAPATQGK